MTDWESTCPEHCSEMGYTIVYLPNPEFSLILSELSHEFQSNPLSDPPKTSSSQVHNFPGLEVTKTPMTPRTSWASFAPGSSTIVGSSPRPWRSLGSSSRTARGPRGSRAARARPLWCLGDRCTGPMGCLEMVMVEMFLFGTFYSTITIKYYKNYWGNDRI